MPLISVIVPPHVLANCKKRTVFGVAYHRSVKLSNGQHAQARLAQPGIVAEKASGVVVDCRKLRRRSKTTTPEDLSSFNHCKQT
mmetsp:Transcript_16287/g.28092  ORF Transcript_16287/g.28092 Transcript_16287/m.28092 type:complete len:84 (+) Transcript_16287:507-758(+)